MSGRIRTFLLDCTYLNFLARLLRALYLVPFRDCPLYFLTQFFYSFTSSSRVLFSDNDRGAYLRNIIDSSKAMLVSVFLEVSCWLADLHSSNSALSSGKLPVSFVRRAYLKYVATLRSYATYSDSIR